MATTNGVVQDASNKNYHLGHYFLHWITQRPDYIFQIDAATGEEETNAQVLARTIELARCLRKIGLKPGDVMALQGKNHLDIHIPYYAGLLNGLPVAGVDPYFEYAEIKSLFSIIRPKIVFCQHEHYNDYARAVEALGLDAKIVTFSKIKTSNSLKKFLETYAEETTEEFAPAEFDTDKVYAWLACTSGTTGVPKVAAFNHKVTVKLFEIVRPWFNPAGVRKRTLHLATTQWISSYANALHVVFNSCKIQTSAPVTADHVIDMINKYRPTTALMSPTLLAGVLLSEKHCDLTCFDMLTTTGGKMNKELIPILKSRLGKGMFGELYAQTETLGPALRINPAGPVGNCGVSMDGLCDVKLIDVETGKEITEPNVPGEMYCFARLRFSEYYNDPEETQKAFENGWYKTGDLLYRDEQGNYFFVDRIKSLIKYKGYHVYPGEVEELIRTLEGVADVCVTSIPHEEDREHPVAVVVRRSEHSVTSQDIIDVVKNNLSVNKQLRGKVMFVEKLPMTSTNKVARMVVKKMVMEKARE